MIALSGVIPFLKLAVEESQQRIVCRYVGASFLQKFSCRNLHCAQTVFIQIVGVHLFYAECRIAVASPASAKIQFLVYTAYAILAAENQSYRVILAIARVGECDLAQQRSEECPRRSQSVYAQSVVRTVVVGPFLMVDYSRWQGVELKITHAVAAYYHCRLLSVECVYDALQRVRR